MRKNRGFMFAELIVFMGVFVVILFPIIMLMNKNIKIVENIRINNEILKTTENIENILINLSEKDKILERYFLDFNRDEKIGVLKSIGGEEITKLRDIKYISLCEIRIFQKRIFFQENGRERELGKIKVAEISFESRGENGRKKVRRILTENLYKKYDYKQ